MEHARGQRKLRAIQVAPLAAPAVRDPMEPLPDSLWRCGNEQLFLAPRVLGRFAQEAGTKSLEAMAKQIEDRDDYSHMGGFFLDCQDTNFDTTAMSTFREKTVACRALHPGLCKSENADTLKDVTSLFQQFCQFLTASRVENTSARRSSDSQILMVPSCTSSGSWVS